MLRTRVIPCLTIENGGLVKTVRFGKRTYLGDPINIVRIFNDKEVDEIILLDISATVGAREPDYALIEKIASQCFMPLSYGGGISNVEQGRRLLNLGVEKLVLNTAAITQPDLVGQMSSQFGSQAVVVSIDAKRSFLGNYDTYTHGGQRSTKRTPVACATAAAAQGCGEILINAIDQDGMMKGYDIKLIRSVVSATGVPTIACGGAGTLEDFRTAVHEGGAAAVAAGSLFVFHGKHRAVLINYPPPDTLAVLLHGQAAREGSQLLP